MLFNQESCIKMIPNKETVINTNMIGNILFTDSKMVKKSLLQKY